MAGINVLSDILKVGNKIEKTLTTKGKEALDSPENAAVVFAAMLSGSMNPIVDPKGQNSSIAGQDSEEKQNTEDSVQSTINQNGLGSVLGYGSFTLPFLIQPMLQSDLPAGKEANSGNDVGQGTENSATAISALTNAPVAVGNNLGLAMLNLVSQASDEVSVSTGMTAQKSQGDDNPAITELDKYRQVISDLLEKLSGEITDKSPKGTSLGSASVGTKDLSQDMVKIIQGWMMATDEVAKDGQVSSGQVTMPNAFIKVLDQLTALSGEIIGTSPNGTPISSESSGTKGTGQDATDQKGFQRLVDVFTTGFGNADPELNAKATTMLSALYHILNQGVKDAKTPQGANETLQPKGLGNDLEPAVTTVKGTAFLTHSQQKSAEVGFQESKTLKGDSTQSVELSGGKDVQNQNSSAGVGVLSNIVASNVVDGKTVAIPVWEQISTVFREQVMNRHQELKELDIQLHPADLGKIQIAMRWENGQVHLQVQASEASTSHLLQNQLSDLRHTLTSQGVNCGMLEMGQGGERQQSSHGDESKRTFDQNTRPNEDEDLIPFTNPISLEQDEINRINVTA